MDPCYVLWLQNLTYPGWNSCNIYNSSVSGYSAIRETTEALGFVHTQVDQSETLSPSLLFNYDILVLGPLLDESFSAAESAAIAEFVAKKRSVLALTAGDVSSLVTNKLISQFGLRFIPPLYEPGCCIDITPHPLTYGVDSVYGEGVLQVDCSGSAISLIRDTFGRNALGVYELTDCKVAAFFDEQFMWNGPTTGIYTDITEADNEQLAVNLFLWLSSSSVSISEDNHVRNTSVKAPCRMGLSSSPNPFNSEIEIKYWTQDGCGCEEKQNKELKLEIFDVTGRLVHSEVSEMVPGNIRWSPEEMATSGTYLVRIATDHTVTTQKITYLK